MLVVLFRHGPAGRPDVLRWPDDSQRPLTPEGFEVVCGAARGLRTLLPAPPAIVSSPFRRAVRTAEILQRELDAQGLTVRPVLESGVTPVEATREILQHDPGTPLVMVGHEPDLGALAGFLTRAGGRLPLEPAGACAVEFAGSVRPGTGDLLWHMPPDLLGRLARGG
jgi:phosphohistidine phosphatase